MEVDVVLLAAWHVLLQEAALRQRQHC